MTTTHAPTRPSTVSTVADYGYFGPESMVWQVWGYPTSLTLGLMRASIVEFFDPLLMAGFDQASSLRYRPRNRYERTVRYFGLVVFGDARSVLVTTDALVKMHLKVTGQEPISGRDFDANDGDQQLWVLLTAWHSILVAYERFGPGPLTAEQEAQYWRECAIAAEFTTASPDTVPTSREEVREYFARQRPRLALHESTKNMLDYFIRDSVWLPPTPSAIAPLVWVADRIVRAAAISLVPTYLQQLSGHTVHPSVAAALRPLLRTTFRFVQSQPRLKARAVATLVPSAAAFMVPMILGTAPEAAVVTTPARAREQYGFVPPAESYRRVRARKVSKKEIADAIAQIGPVL